MTIYYNTKRRSLLMGILILVGFTVYFPAAKEHVSQSLLHEKVVEVGHYIQYVCNTFDFMADEYGLGNEKYRACLAFLVTEVDTTQNTYAELMDDQFNTISTRVHDKGDYLGFDPRKYPEFMEAVRKSEYGNEEVIYAPPGRGPLTLFLQWRWVPTGDYEDKTLLIIGISQSSVDTQFANWLIYGIIALFVVTTVYIVWCIMVLSVSTPNPASTGKRRT